TRCARHADAVTDAADLRTLVAEAVAGGREGWDARSRLEDRLRMIEHRLPDGPGLPTAVDEALTYLEIDPYYFWSGYARARMVKRLAWPPVEATSGERARRYVRDCVDGTKHCSQAELGQLARSVADNALRRDLRARLHDRDQKVGRRALRTLAHMRRPMLTSW